MKNSILRVLFVAAILCTWMQGQVNTAPMPLPVPQFFTATGQPLSGGKIFTYSAGTTTPLATYTDGTGLVQNTNPVILNAGGYPTNAGGSVVGIWLGPQKYKVILQNSLGVQQWLVDQVGGNNLFSLANLNMAESTPPSCNVGSDILWGDSAAHRFKMCNNNGAGDIVVGQNSVDTLINKTLITATLTNPVINNPTITGGNLAREGQVSDADVYVSSNGADANDGLSLGTAKLTLGGAQAACPTTFCVIHISSGGLTLSGSVTFAHAVTLKCEPRNTITYSSNNNQLIFNAQGSAVFGCGFTGQGSGIAGASPIVSNQNFFVFSHNSVSSFGATGGLGEVSLTGGQNILILDNIFNQNGDLDVAVLNSTNAQVMFSILVSGNIGSDILLSNTGTGASLAAVNIENNNLSDGEAGKTNPCIKSIATNGINISDLTIMANVCVVSQATAPVPFAIANVTQLAFTGNVYDASGFGVTTNAGTFTNINGGAIMGNTFSNTGFGGGLVFERMNLSNVSGNVVTGLSATGTAYTLTVTTTSGTSASNIFSGNTASLPGGSTGTGFTLVCNATSATCSNNTFNGNTVFNGTVGISLINTTGTTSGTFIGSNVLNTTTTGVSVGAGVSNASIEPQKFIAVTTPFADSGTGTDIQNRSYFQAVTLGGGTGTLTIPAGGAFTSTSTFACNSNDTTTIANASKAVPASTTTATVTGTGTDVIAVTCTGH